MKIKDSITDYLGFIVVKIIGFVVRILPLRLVVFLGALLGNLFYYLDPKHKSMAYSNIKSVMGPGLSLRQLKKLVKEFYRNFGKNIMDVFLLPRIDKKYLDKYISIEGLEYIKEAFKKGKGIIILPVHEGSWEISNIVAANKFGVSYNVVVQDQKHPRLNRLLNSYRLKKGCKLISRRNQTRNIIEALKNNEAIGITLDQGGRSGTLVRFFSKEASFASGAIRLALKYDSALIPVFSYRLRGPRIKIIIKPAIKIKKSGDTEADVLENLSAIVPIFEELILKYPKEYLWFYKIWKYSNERDILILSDGKTGHLHQSQALSKIVDRYFRSKGIKTNISVEDVRFRGGFYRNAVTIASALSGRHHCQGCLWCLRKSLSGDVYKSLSLQKPDVIISCGSSVAPVNYILARENSAKSLVIMRPSVLSTKRFDLVVIPRHDNPFKRKNIAVTNGALNLIDEEYLDTCVSQIKQYLSGQNSEVLTIGLLLGGDAKGFRLSEDFVKNIIGQLKKSVEYLDAQILVTTSRRTSPEIEKIVKEEFRDYPKCKLLIIANENNFPFAFGGILGLSQIIVVSPESISMISEAISSKKYVITFKAQGLSGRHRSFLNYLAKNKYLYLSKTMVLAELIDTLQKNKPAVKPLGNEAVILEKLGKIL